MPKFRHRFVGCERAVHFYAMDYIEGQTLAEVIRNLRGLEGLEGEAPEDGGKGVSDLADSLASGRFAPPEGSSDPEAPTAAYTRDHTPGATTETKRTPQAAISTERSTKSPAYFRSIAEIGVQVAEALDHAHEHGVVHRDVKPSNVILDNAGKPWVTDFGLARIETDATLTVSGDLLGTVRYMSPEQALAKRIVVDHRTDVYSLGVTLYELLTLQPVFSGQDRQELLRQIAFEEPKSPQRLNKAIPAELEIIVLKAMAKNPAERYETAQDLADDLRRFLEDRPIRARRPTLIQRAAKWSRRHKPIVWSAAVSVFVLLVVGLVGLGIGNIIITWQPAVNAFTKALQIIPSNRWIHLGLAWAQVNLEQYDQALTHLRTALELDPVDTSKFWCLAAQRLARTPETRERLLDIVDEAVERSPTPAVAYADRGGLLRLLGEEWYEKAEADYAKAAELDPKSGHVWSSWGNYYSGRGMLKEAREKFSKGVEGEPDHWLSQYAEARMNLCLGDFEAAVRGFTRSIELNPSYAETFALRGVAYLRSGRPDESRADLEHGISLLASVSHRAHSYHALLCLMLGETPKYADICAGMVQGFAKTDDPTVANYVAWTCALAPEAVDDYKPVLALAMRAVEAQPDSDSYLNTLGRVLLRAGRHEEAIERLTELDRRQESAEGAEKSPRPSTWYFLAMAHQKAGNAEQAREFLKKANQSTDEAFADEEKPRRWDSRPTWELLRKEAESLLGTDVEESAESGQKPKK